VYKVLLSFADIRLAIFRLAIFSVENLVIPFKLDSLHTGICVCLGHMLMPKSVAVCASTDILTQISMDLLSRQILCRYLTVMCKTATIKTTITCFAFSPVSPFFLSRIKSQHCLRHWINCF
jgi:hypothetical protein